MSSLLTELIFEYRSGDKVTFPIPEGVLLSPGQRYKISVHTIDERDERSTSVRPDEEPSKVAARLVSSGEFQDWAKQRMREMGRGNLPKGIVSATEFIKIWCDVTSLEALDVNDAALVTFERRIEIPFYRHIGIGRA